MNIKKLLLGNGYAVTGISEAILNKEIPSDTTIRVTGGDKCDLFDGFELTSDREIYSINLEDNEFTPFAVFHIDEENYIIGETGYDENLNLVYNYTHEEGFKGDD